MSGDGRETEIKLAARDAEWARRALRRAGFRVSKRRTFEDNTVFDTPALALRKKARLLRLREAGGKAIVTYKGAPIASKHKSREELEVEVSDAGTLRAIVERVGFEAIFRYQKYRTEHREGAAGGASRRRSGVATLDETPIGVYIEIEGEPGWIDRTARLLGYSEDDYITASYARLYFEWCAREKVRPGDMTF